MNSPYARTRLRPEEPDFSRAFDHYSPRQFLDRLSLPAVVTAAVVIATLAFNLLRSPTLSRRIQTSATLLWDCIVALTPVFLIHTLDKWMNPPMFPGIPPASPPSTHAEKSEKMAALLRPAPVVPSGRPWLRAPLLRRVKGPACRSRQSRQLVLPE